MAAVGSSDLIKVQADQKLGRKRKRDEKEEEIWILVETNYTDDYKPRGDDWSATRPPKLFRSKHEAEIYERKVLMDWVDDALSRSSSRLDEFCTKHPSYQKYFSDEGFLKRCCLENGADNLIYEIQEALDVGEFVPRTFSTSVVKGQFPPIPDVPECGSDCESGVDQDTESDQDTDKSATGSATASRSDGGK